jgi:hypothetical protein
MGFGEGPYPIPRSISLVGSVPGVAIVRPATPGHPETIKVGAAGRISPLGRTTVGGSLRVVGGVMRGTLVLDSAQSSASLRVSGPAPQASSPTPTSLAFELDGTAVGSPYTTYRSQAEFGSGTLALTLAPGSGRVRLTLVFQSR